MFPKRKQKVNPMRFIRVVAVLLLLGVGGKLQAGPLGAAILSADYDGVKKITTVHIVNNSHQEISDVNMSFYVTKPDGSVGNGGEINLEWAEGFAQGVGGLAPGAVHDYQFTGQEGAVTATIDLVVYKDGSADVLNRLAFERVQNNRQAQISAWAKIGELLKAAVNDSADPHPTETVIGQLQALYAQVQQGSFKPKGATVYGGQLQIAMQNLSNKAGQANERQLLRDYVQRDQARTAALSAHTSLRAVQP
jgi:hypothetical protein